MFSHFRPMSWIFPLFTLLIPRVCHRSRVRKNNPDRRRPRINQGDREQQEGEFLIIIIMLMMIIMIMLPHQHTKFWSWYPSCSAVFSTTLPLQNYDNLPAVYPCKPSDFYLAIFPDHSVPISRHWRRENVPYMTNKTNSSTSLFYFCRKSNQKDENNKTVSTEDPELYPTSRKSSPRKHFP